MFVRSYLYVPGDQPDKLAKATGCGADAVIADLEDAVPRDRKEIARAAVVEFLRTEPSVPVWVRVNNDALLEGDLAAAKAAGALGVVLPKASVDSLALARAMSELPLVPLLETAQSVLDVRAVAGAGGVHHLAMGEADLKAELSIDPSGDEHEWWPIRTAVVLASVAAGLERPTGPVSTDFRDLDGFRQSTEGLRRFGFGSRAAIHPAQVEIINDVFTPSTEEIDSARDLVERFEAAGGGVLLDDQGRMVDEAVVRAARRMLVRDIYPPDSGG